ncbi:MAG: type III secretion system export apparatus subunit SctT [Gammaproteobacteria bacterium]
MDMLFVGNHWLLVLTVTLPRFLAIFMMLPFFRREFISTTARNGIAIILSVVILPVVSKQLSVVEFDGLLFILMIAKEAVIGVLIGYTAGIIFWAVASMGEMIDLQRGAMSAQMFAPIIGGQTSPLGSFLAQTVAVILFSTGGFIALLAAIYQTYVIWPVTSYYPQFNIETAIIFLQQFDQILAVALLMAAPIIVIIFLAEFALGLMGRFVPTVNIFLLAMPIKSVLVFFVLGLYLGTILVFLKGRILSQEYLPDILMKILL